MLAELIKTKFLAAVHKFTDGANVNSNEQPIIGIVTQAVDDSLVKANPKFADYQSYMMADYVQFMEGSGARVIPILDTELDAETLDKLGKINGVLFPGGAGDEQYKLKAQFIYKQAIKMNDNGEFFPLWGICQGFEYLAMFAADAGDAVLTKLESHDVSIPIKFEVDPEKTKMFHAAGKDAKLYEETPSAFMSHTWGIDPKKFETDKGLAKMFTMTSTSYDCIHDSTFVSSMESPDYPF